MKKKKYIQPALNVVSIECQHLIAWSRINTNFLVTDMCLSYDENGDAPENAW